MDAKLRALIEAADAGEPCPPLHILTASVNARLDELRPTWQLMSEAHDERDETITLVAAEVWPLSGGDGLALPAVRVPAGAITAWWSGTAGRLKVSTQWSFGFGVITPIGHG